MPEFKSTLPYGQALPVGDQALWDAIMASGATGDIMQTYADVRGISRQAAKHETFIFRYGSAGRFKLKEVFNK